jgi:hypothetical protein
MRSADSPQIQRTRDTLRGAQVWSLAYVAHTLKKIGDFQLPAG